MITSLIATSHSSGAAAAAAMTTMTPMAAQATEISGGGVPTPIIYIVFCALGFGFMLSVFIGVKAAKLMN